MPVPTLVTDLSTTLASNSPAGSDNVFPDLDNYLRALSAFVASIRDNSGNGWTTPYLALAGGTATGNVNVPSLNSGQLAGLRNRIINGKMDISQRGTSFAAIATGSYTLDRWSYNGVAGTSVVTISQQSDVPSSNEFQNSLRLAVTTADTSIAAGENTTITQVIEGYNARDLIGKTFTLSFWVRSSKTGTHCIAFRNSGTDRSYVAEYTVNAANTWETKSITVSGGLITAGTWNWTNGAGLYMTFALAAGTTFQTTAGAWQTGNFVATSNQVNCLDSNTNIFALTGVQLEVGGVATPFEHRPIGVELALCQRYFERVKYTNFYLPSTTATAMYVPIVYKVTKRAVPSSISLPASTNQGYNNSGGQVTPTTWTTIGASEDGFSIHVGNSSLGGFVNGTADVNSEL